VTIGLPVLDGEPYLSEAIDSILAQSFTDFELVISDNASTDRTEEICRAYASRDPRVRYMRSPVNIGGALNFNRVLDEARGLYFKWAAHDDVLAPTWLARAVSTLDDQPSAVLCQSLITVIDQDGAVVGPEERLLTRVTGGRAAARFGNLVLADHRCNDLFGLIRTGILRRTGGIGRYIAADRVLLAELGLHGRFETIPEPLFFVRDHPARSVNARPFHERTSWYDTTAPDRTVFPHWRFYREYFRLPGRARVAPLQRLRCYGHLCRWPWANMNWARLVSDVLIAARPGLNRRLTQMGRRLVRPG
jgi:glycosyltransferase involved in cell wall biosynthesis